MSKTAKRLIFAAMLSMAGFASTILWYHLSATEDQTVSTAKPIARLVATVNDVQKKPVQKIIWQAANLNEVLRVGEAIRTAPNSEARIEFIHSATAIDLEADSAIVLEENNGQLSLDFLKGHIVVKSDATATSNGSVGSSAEPITLKTGGKQIALGQSELSLGKTKTGALDVQVLKGQIAGLENFNQDKIKVLSPLPGEPIYVNPAKSERAVVRWQKLSPDYEVFVEAGPTRQDLQPLPGALAIGDRGELAAAFKPGRGFFRLVARPKDPQKPELTSTVLRAMVIAKIPPVPLYPEKDAVVTVDKNDATVKLLWSNPAGFTKVIVESSTSPDLKRDFKIDRLENASELTLEPKKTGMIYWRVSGVLEGRREVVSSPVQKFSAQVLDQVQPPTLDSPRAEEKILYESVKEKGVHLSWNPAPSAQSYKVIVEKQSLTQRSPSAVEKVFEDEGKKLQTTVSDLAPGTYAWHVVSIGADGEASKASEKRRFTLQTLPVLQWTDGKTSDDQYYLTLKPSITLRWEKGAPLATSWTAKIYAADSDQVLLEKKFLTTGADLALPADGRYVVEILAQDDRGGVVARSARRELKVAPAPLLPGPEFATSMPNEIEASGRGQARFEWKAVQGADKYILFVKSHDGKVQQKLSFNTLEGSLNNLMPGEYQVSVGTIDQHGRLGPEGEARKLKVPNESSLKAPKLKGFKVK